MELFADGISLGVKHAEDRFFRFTVPNQGEIRLEAVAGDCRDSGTICHVDTPDERYRLKEQGAVLNWFDITEKEGGAPSTTPSRTSPPLREAAPSWVS